MTVKCVSYEDKKLIIRYYQGKLYSQKELASVFQTSPRTINRILVEAGLATAVPRIKGEAYQVMQLLKKYQLQPDELELVITMGKSAIKSIEEELFNETHQQNTEFADVPF